MAPPIQLVARHSGKCATIDNSRNGPQLVQRSCDASRPDQQWMAQPMGNGATQLTSMATRACLDVEGASTADGAHIVLFGCKAMNDNANQLWMVRATPRGSALMAMHSRRCLNVSGGESDDGARFVQGDCADKDYQLFDMRVLGAGPSMGGEPIVGDWRWFNGATITVRADGTMSGTNGQRGRWSREMPGRYVLTWDEGWIDRLMLEGNRMHGSNQSGTAVNADKLTNNLPEPQSTGPVQREESPNMPNFRQGESGPQVRSVDNGKRDCGTGHDDPGCSLARGRDLPMDAGTFVGTVTALKATPNELTRRDMTRQLIGAKLMTARQMGGLLDLFQNENNALDVVRSLARNVVDPNNLGAYASKFRNSTNRVTYAKILSEAQAPQQAPMQQQRLDMRRR